MIPMALARVFGGHNRHQTHPFGKQAQKRKSTTAAPWITLRGMDRESCVLRPFQKRFGSVNLARRAMRNQEKLT
jgi:hypothetical protein